MKQHVNYLKHHREVCIRMSDDDITAIDVSVYNALFMLWNMSGFESELSINRSEVMNISKVGNKNTYTASLHTLNDKGYLTYKPSHNPMIGSVVSLTIFGKSDGTSTGTKSGKSSGKSSGNSDGNSDGTLPKPSEPTNLQTSETLAADAAGKAEKIKEVTPYWSHLKKVWFDFYKARFNNLDPSFGAGASTALKSILTRLQKHSSVTQKTKDLEWSEDYAEKVFTHFLTKAYSDKWRQANFRLTILSSHYDSIITGNEHTTGKNRTTGGLNAAYKAKLVERMAEASGGSTGDGT